MSEPTAKIYASVSFGQVYNAMRDVLINAPEAELCGMIAELKWMLECAEKKAAINEQAKQKGGAKP